MVRRIRLDVISCLGTNFNQPIADLVSKLLAVQLSDPDGKPRSAEVDYSVCLIVMLVVAFEAWMARARHFDLRVAVSSDDKSGVLLWLRTLNDPRLKALIARLGEIYFLRDAIVHNHIWTYVQVWNNGQPQYRDFNIDSTWQSRPIKIDRIILEKLPSSTAPRTRRLNLSVVPGFVGRRDIAIVFKTVKDALSELDKLDYASVVPKVPHVRFDGNLSFPFWRLISVLQRSSMNQRVK